MNVFLGITGASGAPYAARLLAELSRLGHEVGVCVSASGREILATELYDSASLPHEEVVARLTRGLGGVSVYGESDYRSPYASGSARVDGYVVCPCSMASAAVIATGGSENLVHRAASVALKERRKLVLVPRETPLSSLHLDTLLRLSNAGAVVLPAAPGFYHHPQSVDDLVGFVVARVLDHLGVDNDISGRWGALS